MRRSVRTIRIRNPKQTGHRRREFLKRFSTLNQPEKTLVIADRAQIEPTANQLIFRGISPPHTPLEFQHASLVVSEPTLCLILIGGIASRVVHIMPVNVIIGVSGSVVLIVYRSRVIRRHPIVHPAIILLVHYVRRYPQTISAVQPP